MNARDPRSLNDYTYARDNPLAFIDPSGLSWNPATWTVATWFAFGVAVGLVVVAAVQVGLDPLSDAAAGLAISDFLGSVGLTAAAVAGSAVGLPIILGVNEEADPTVDELFMQFEAILASMPRGEPYEPPPIPLPNIVAEADTTGGRLGEQDLLDYMRYYGRLANEYYGMMSGGEGEYVIDLTGGGSVRADRYFGATNSIDQLKLGASFDKQQLAGYTEAIGLGKVKPGFWVELKSPWTGEVGPGPEKEAAIKAVGFNILHIDYDWWEAFH